METESGKTEPNAQRVRIPEEESEIKTLLKRLAELETKLVEADAEKSNSRRLVDMKGKEFANSFFAKIDQKMTFDELEGDQVHRQKMYKEEEPVYGIPPRKEMKLAIAKFSGREQYRGLGAGFNEWGHRFLRQVLIAQKYSNYWWPEDIKIDCLSAHL